MSIINRMLKDLELTSTSATESGVYRPAKRRMPLWYALIVLLIPIALWAWWPIIQSPTAPIVKPKVIDNPIQQPTIAEQNDGAAESAAAMVAANPSMASTPPSATTTEETHSLQSEPSESQLPAAEPENVVLPSVGMNEPESESEIAPSFEPEPAAELVIEEQKLSAGQIAALERKKYQVAMQKRDLAAAKQALQLVLANDPLDITSRQQLAALYYGENQLDAALQILTQGIQQLPTNADLRLLAARVMQAKGQPVAALNVLTAISPSARNNIDFYAMRAALAQQTGVNHEAITSYQALTVAEPSSGRWWVGLGIAYEKSTQPDFARSAYQHALADPSLSAASKQFSAQRLQRLKER